MYEDYRSWPGSPGALVAPWAQLGHGVVIHPHAIVGRLPDESSALARQPLRSRELYIGARTVIGPGAVIYGGTSILDDCLIGDHASIREGCVIGNRVVIGRHVTINYDCVILDDSRFQDFTHLTGGATVGRGCFFGVNVVTSNDRRVDLVDYHYPGPNPCRFGDRVMIGSGANILAGVTIGDDALIGAGALVVKDVPSGATMLGSPSQRRWAPGAGQGDVLAAAMPFLGKVS